MDYYELLEVHPTASAEVIRASFRALSQKWHPDRNEDATATARTQALNEAYRTLSDPVLRAAYDQAHLHTARSALEQPSSQQDWASEVDEDLPPQWLVVIGFTISMLVASINFSDVANSLLNAAIAVIGCGCAFLAARASLKIVKALRAASQFEQAGDLLATMLILGASVWAMPHIHWMALKPAFGWPLLIPAVGTWVTTQAACRCLAASAADFTIAGLFRYVLAFVGGWLILSLVFAVRTGGSNNWATIPGFIGAVFGIFLLSSGAFLLVLMISELVRRFTGFDHTPRAASLIFFVLAMPATLLGIVAYAAIFK